MHSFRVVEIALETNKKRNKNDFKLAFTLIASMKHKVICFIEIKHRNIKKKKENINRSTAITTKRANN